MFRHGGSVPAVPMADLRASEGIGPYSWSDDWHMDRQIHYFA